MNKVEIRKSLKLNNFDRQVLQDYSNVSLETGKKIAAEAAEIKAIHKNLLLKV